MSTPSDPFPLRTTPLHGLHVSLGAKMVPFAGYEMPVQYATGIIKEHLHTRSAAGLFDVSHMGQAMLEGDDPARALERLTPADVAGLKDGQMRYALLLSEDGCIKDDFMAARVPGESALLLVVNAGTKEATSITSRRSWPAWRASCRKARARSWRFRDRSRRPCWRATPKV
jgi:aminomethyltransferase